MELTFDDLTLTLDDSLPLVRAYSVAGRSDAFAGAGDNASLIVNRRPVPFEEFDVEAEGPGAQGQTASYRLFHRQERYRIDIEFRVEATEARFRLTVAEDPDEVVGRIAFRDMDLLTVTDPTFRMWRMDMPRDSWKNGPPPPQGTYWARTVGPIAIGESNPDLAPTPLIHACAFDESLCCFVRSSWEVLPLTTELRESARFPERAGSFGIGLNSYQYRVRGKTMPPLEARVVFLSDINDDGKADQCDYQLWVNRSFPDPDPFYRNRVWYKMRCVDQPRGELSTTFDQALEIIRAVHNLLEGTPQLVYLYGAVDDSDSLMYTLHPLAGNIEDYYRLVDRAQAEYNCVVSHHFNVDEILADSPHVEKDIACRNPDGELRIWDCYEWGGKRICAYHYNHTKAMERGTLKSRVERSIEVLKLRKSAHFDAHRITNSSWEADGEFIGMVEELECGVKPLLRFYKERGIDVSVEGINGSPIDGPLLFSAFHHLSFDPMNHGKVFGGGYCVANNWAWGKGAGIDGDLFYGGRNEINAEGGFQEYSYLHSLHAIKDLIFLGYLLYRFYLEREMYEVRQWSEPRLSEKQTWYMEHFLHIRFGDGTTTDLRKQDDYLLVRSGDVVVAEGYDRFLPIGDTIHVYSRDGGQRSWVLPEAFRRQSLDVYSVNVDGRGPAPEYRVDDSTIYLDLPPRLPVKIALLSEASQAGAAGNERKG